MLSNRGASARTSTGAGGCCSSSTTSGAAERASCCGSSRVSRDEPHATDPVCGMIVDPASPPGGSIEIDGGRVYFCSTFCKARFASQTVARP